MGIKRYHSELTLVDKNKNENIIYPKTTISDVYTTSTSGTNITGKLIYYAECSTQMHVKEKTVSIPGFILEDGVHVTIRFTAINSIFAIPTSWTLQINSLAAKVLNMSTASMSKNVTRVKSGDTITFVYDKSRDQFIRVDSSPWILVEMDSSNNTTRFNLMGVTDVSYLSEGTYTNIDKVMVRSGIYVEGSTLYSDKFDGNGSNITGLNASNISSGTLSSSRLPDINGLNAATYGPSSDSTLTASGKFTIPNITVDSKGRITNIVDRTLSLPKDENDKVAVFTIPDEYKEDTYKNLDLTFFDYSTNGTNPDKLLVCDNIFYNPSSNRLYVKSTINASKLEIRGNGKLEGLYSNGTVSWSIDNGVFSGTSRKVSSISDHISATENSSTKAYPSANGIELEKSVTSLKNSKQNTITGAATTITDSNLTADRVLITDSNGKVAASGITATKLSYLSGVTADVQTQLGNIANIINPIGSIGHSFGHYTIKTSGTLKWGNEISGEIKSSEGTTIGLTLLTGIYILIAKVAGKWKGSFMELGVSCGIGTASFYDTTYVRLPDNGTGQEHRIQYVTLINVTGPSITVYPRFIGGDDTTTEQTIQLSIGSIRIK